MVLTELLKVSDGLANQSFCWSDISRVELKSNWTVGERLLASDQEAVTDGTLILLKGLGALFNASFQNLLIYKRNSVM